MAWFDSVIAFGDSNVDNGNAAAAAASRGITLNPIPNYGGRSSNGPVVVEYLAQDLGVPLLDYAYVGATTGRGYGTPYVLNTLSQVEGYLGANGGRADPGALYVIWAGSNDLSGVGSDAGPLGAAIAGAVANITAAIDALSAAGADAIVVANRTPRTSLDGQDNLNGIALNAALADAVPRIDEGAAARVVLFDDYGLIADMIARPGAYGFGRTGPGDLAISDPVASTDPGAAAAYVFWDAGHKTTRVHDLLADAIVRQVVLLPHSQDFGGDGRDDVVWRGQGGEVAVWSLSGAAAAPAGSGVAGDPGGYWTIAGTGDFGGDGRSDILFRGQGGELAAWAMDGARPVGGAATFLPSPGAYWSVAGTGDFGRDGRDDILWRGQGGEVAVWDLSGGTVLPGDGTGVVAGNPGNHWSVAGTGDFNGDGRFDVLFAGAGGAVAIWSMDGARLIGGQSSFFSAAGPYWTAVGAGDFNGDGRSDILWRGQGGEVATWHMDGDRSLATVANTVLGGGANVLGNPGNFWQVADVQDVTGDGRSDILWRGQDGSAYVWHIDGAAVLPSSTAIAAPGAYWTLA